MDELPEKLRQHYDRQSLPPAALTRMLAAGSKVRREKFRWRVAAWSIAAVLAVSAGFFIYRHDIRPFRSIETQEIEGALEAFFAPPGHPIARVSADLPDLRAWLRQQGAPADAVVPATVSQLPAFGCHVLKVGPRSVYLLCFVLDPGREASGKTMKKDATLVHLVSVPLNAFKVAPAAGDPVIRRGEGAWNFAEWRSGDVVYIAAGEVAPERLQSLVASL